MSIEQLFATRGVPVTIHIETDRVPCPCRTPEGYRNPAWHKAHPEAPECNDAGFLVEFNETIVKVIMMPASSATRSGMSNATQLFGEIKTDDYLGVFPIISGIDFSEWSPAGESFIEYNGMHFLIVGYALLADPRNTNILHHWELGLRRIESRLPDDRNIY